MSEPFRRLGEQAVLQQMHSTQLALSVVATAYMEYFGSIPPELDKRLNLLVKAKVQKIPSPAIDAVLNDVKMVVQDYKRTRVSLA